MANFIEEFFYGNLDSQARSTKQNRAVQKQMEILMNNEEKLTVALDDENKKLFLDFANVIFEQMGGTYTKVGDYYLPNLIPAEEETSGLLG